jgi:hypothetical protein
MEAAQHEDAPPANSRAVKLPPFWTTNTRAWFTSVEEVFRLHNIADEESRFFNCLHALPEATVCLIADLVEADPLPQKPYTELRRRLLAAHQLTDIQRVGCTISHLWRHRNRRSCWQRCFVCVPGARRTTPSSTACSSLPRELRILLSKVYMADKKALARQGRPFAAHNSKQAHDVVAAVAAGSSSEQEGEETTVQWLQSAQEPAAGNAPADSGVAAGGVRRSRDPLAADSRCPIC